MDERALSELLKKYPTVMHGDDGKTVITCVARLSFVNFKEPRPAQSADGKPRYDCAVLLPAAADLSPLKAACGKAWDESDVKKKRGTPKGSPLKSQAENAEKYDGFDPNGFYFNAATVNPVDLFNIDMTKAPVDKFYSGCWARVKVRAYAFDKNGNWGVSFGLQAVQFFADDEKLGGGGNAADGFEAHGGAVNGSRPAQMPEQSSSVW